MEIVTACITIFGGLVLAAATYGFTKKRERDAEWRREKLERYKAYITGLSGVIDGNRTPSSRRLYATACNELHLFAPPAVLKRLHEFQDYIGSSNASVVLEAHDNLLTALLLEIRRDLGLKRETTENFKARMWSSGG